MKHWAFWCCCLLFLAGCGAENSRQTNAQEEQPAATGDKAQQIVDAAIETHGGDNYKDCRVEFDFRDRHYIATRQGARFEYERIFNDSTGAHIRDVLNSDGFYREVNGQRVELSEKESSAYSNSVNSVIYFALLPYFLNDPAVIKEYAGEAIIKEQPYHKVKVTFRQEGGGKDFEDEYLYWIHRDEHTVDYLAYNFLADGGGARFREAYSVIVSNGIRFANYHNYKPRTDNRNIAGFDSLFQKGALELISDIKLEKVQVVLDYW